MLELLILAAGKSRRYGGDKRFVAMPKGGRLLPALVRRGNKAGLRVNVVVAEGDALQQLTGARLLRSSRAGGGMGYSLADAISQLDSNAEAILIMPADLPLIRINSLRRVAEAARAGNIVIPVCNGRRGHPVAIGRKFWPELTELSGDIGARPVLAAHPEYCQNLVLDDPGICADGDTPAQMQQLFSQLEPPE